MKNGAVITIGLLGAFATFPMTAHADTPTVHRQYLQAVDDLRHAGIATTPAEIWPASAPVDQNAAPLYTKLHDDFTVSQGETDALAVTGGSPTDADWTKARAFVDANPELIALVHQIASMPLCVVPGRATAAEPAAILFPEVAQIRRAERIIAVESAVMAHDGQGVKAVSNAGLGFQLANHAYSEPTLIGWLVGIAVDAIAVNNIDRIMVMNRNDPAVASAANLALAGWQQHSMKPALSGEAVSGLAEITILRAGDPSKLSELYGEGPPPSLKPVASSPEAWHDFVDANGLVLAQIYKKLIAASDQPYPIAYPEVVAIDASMAAQGDDHQLAHILCPVFDRSVSKQATIEARVALAHACAALLTYKAAHGNYPGDLGQAMAMVPVDPYDQEPIHYRPDGGGFVVYSVGETGAYAGGTSAAFENVLRVSADGILTVSSK